jgi:hypothetical protein
MKITYEEKNISGFPEPCTLLKLTTREHNKLFKYRQRTVFTGYDVCVADISDLQHAKGAMRKTITPFGIFVETILLPIQILIDGLGNIKDTWRNYKSHNCSWEFFADYDLTHYT